MIKKFRWVARCVGLALPALGLLGTPAMAADLAVMAQPPVAPAPEPLPKPIYLRFGATGVFLDQSVRTTIAGRNVSGGVRTDPVATAYVEAGYFLRPWLTTSISGGFPPLLTEKGTGPFAPFGTLTKVRAGVVTATLQYHADFGRFHPYIGGGLAYAIVFHNVTGAIAHPRLGSNVGPAIVAGVYYDLTPHWSAFVDIKNIWVSQRQTGLIAPFPGAPKVLSVRARVHNDVILVAAGLGYRF